MSENVIPRAGDETRRGYLYVPRNRNEAVAVYAIEHVTIATVGCQPVRDRRVGVHVARAEEVRRAAEDAAPGLYKVKILVNRYRSDVWTLTRGKKIGSPIDELARLTAVARKWPEGRRSTVRTLRDARRARALADGLRLHVLPLAAPAKAATRAAEVTA